MVVTDAQGGIRWVNPEFERNTGYSLSEVRGRKPSLLASGKTPMQTFSEMWSAVMTGAPGTGISSTAARMEPSTTRTRRFRPCSMRAVSAWHRLHQEVSQRMREQGSFCNAASAGS